MGDGYTSSFGLNRRPLSPRLGEELRLQLDPRIEIWLGRMVMDGDVGRARNYALHPQWRGLEIEEREIFGPRLIPRSSDPANVPVFKPVVAPPIPLCPTSKPPDPPKPPKPGEKPPEPKAGDVSDVLDAVSKTEQYQCTVGRLFDTLERSALRDWRSLSTPEKVLVITGGATIAGGAVAGLLSNSEGRRLALDKILGADIPVPGVRGLSLKILREDQAPGQPKPPEGATPRPVGVFFTLDVLKFMQNFPRMPDFRGSF
jgi:hypothetical protein